MDWPVDLAKLSGALHLPRPESAGPTWHKSDLREKSQNTREDAAGVTSYGQQAGVTPERKRSDCSERRATINYQEGK